MIYHSTRQVTFMRHPDDAPAQLAVRGAPAGPARYHPGVEAEDPDAFCLPHLSVTLADGSTVHVSPEVAQALAAALPEPEPEPDEPPLDYTERLYDQQVSAALHANRTRPERDNR